jgi:hypothetical protein
VSQTPQKYDSQDLATGLTKLSSTEIEDMLAHIEALESHLTKLQVHGRDDAMIQLVRDGLFRLTYFLDAVKRHQAVTDESL